MRLPRSSALLALLFVTDACSSGTAPVDVGGVQVRVASGELVIHNGTASPVFSIAMGREIAALIDWIPCADPDRCNPLAAGAVRHVPLATINGGAERELLFYWWHGVATPNGWGPDSIRSAIVKTR